MIVTVEASEAVIVAFQETDEVLVVPEKCHVQPWEEIEVVEVEAVVVGSQSGQLVLEAEVATGEAVLEDGSQTPQLVLEEIEELEVLVGSQSDHVVVLLGKLEVVERLAPVG